jgi:hypothetical protein
MADGMSSSPPAHKKVRQMMDEDFQHVVFLKEPKPQPDMGTVHIMVPYQTAIMTRTPVPPHLLHVL